MGGAPYPFGGGVLRNGHRIRECYLHPLGVYCEALNEVLQSETLSLCTLCVLSVYSLCTAAGSLSVSNLTLGETNERLLQQISL